MNLHQLIEKAKRGNPRAFSQAVEPIAGQMYKTAFMQLGNEHDALDAVQEALMKAFSSIGNLKHNEFFKTWLIRILLNECHNIQRYRNKVIPMEKESIATPVHDVQGEESAIEMRELLERMDDLHKEIIDLRYNHDLKLVEISEMLGIPLGTVKSRLSNAHRLLRKQVLLEEVSV